MSTINLLEKALNIRAFYQKVIAGNVANVDTPGYKEKNIDFKKELDKNISNIAQIEVVEKTSSDGLVKLDGNTVNLEKQTVQMTENNLMFSALVQIVSKKIAMMKFAISEGRR